MHYRVSPRLSGFDYRGTNAYSITIVTRRRHRAFANPAVAEAGKMALLDSANSYSFAVHAYCFMPDHLHLLTSGQERQSLVRFIQHFKQRSSFAYKREAGRLLWQTSFWDHILRESEDMVDVARYIWANPVRAGLAEDLRAYPFSGPSPLPAVAWQS